MCVCVVISLRSGCYEMFYIAGAIAVNADSFSEGSADRVYTNVNCVGNESRLVECSLSPFSGISCTTVGVVCQRMFK